MYSIIQSKFSSPQPNTKMKKVNCINKGIQNLPYLPQPQYFPAVHIPAMTYKIHLIYLVLQSHKPPLPESKKTTIKQLLI